MVRTTIPTFDTETSPAWNASRVRSNPSANAVASTTSRCALAPPLRVVRDTAQAQLALSSASSFRATIPPGPIRNEDYLTALPYKNKILTFQMSGTQVQALLDLTASRRGSDLFGVTSGVRFVIEGSRATQVTVRKSASDAQQTPLRSDGTYTVMATDYIANIATGYKDLLAQPQPVPSATW